MGIRFIGAATSLGLEPYADGSPRRVDEAAATYRSLGLIARLGAEDLGDLTAGSYPDRVRPAGDVRNGEAIAEYSRRLADVVAENVGEGERLVVGGGDCSVVLGALLGLSRRGRHGLVYVDGHCDFATPAISLTGGVAGMDVALATGRGDHDLARLDARGPLVREEDVVVLARKDERDEVLYGDQSVRNTRIADIPWQDVQAEGIDRAVARTLERVEDARLDGFWIHFDVDVLDPGLISAVDTPEEGGMGRDDAIRVLRALWRSPRARGIDITIYDPGLDPTFEQGREVVEIVSAGLSQER